MFPEIRRVVTLCVVRGGREGLTEGTPGASLRPSAARFPELGAAAEASSPSRDSADPFASLLFMLIVFQHRVLAIQHSSFLSFELLNSFMSIESDPVGSHTYVTRP